MIDQVFSKTEEMVNKVLALDPFTQQRLAELSGKLIEIEIRDIEQSFRIGIQGQAISLRSCDDQQADVVISGRPLSLFGLLMASAESQNVFPKNVEIKGDINLAQRFQQILKELDLDWEEALSHYVGDTAARKLNNAVRSGHSVIKQAGLSFMQDLSEFLRFEREVVPDHGLINEYNSEVDAVRDDAERLRMRIERMEKQLLDTGE